MRRLFLVVMLIPAALLADPPKSAKNVILLLADAGGIATLNAASLLGHNAPQRLFVQSWPHVGLSDTSTASQWVTDSAAGMTAIVTGRKTHNGIISQGPDAQRSKIDGTALKTILEYAEEKGLSTGVLSNVTIADATPAACYAHANDRRKLGEIYLEIFSPRFGDGVDIVFGPGRKLIFDRVRLSGKDLDVVAQEKNRPVYASLSDVPSDARRALVLTEGEFDLNLGARMAIRALSRNPKGYFLMIESDAHTNRPREGLTRLLNFDKLIREIAGMVDLNETLLVFTADHSFDLRVRAGGPNEPLLKGLDEWAIKPKETIELPFVRVDDSHTGEEVVVAATGPGAERVKGFLPNTEIFRIMMAAYGWTESN